MAKPSISKEKVLFPAIFALGVAFLLVRVVWMERHDSVLLRAVVDGNVPTARKALEEGATMSMPIRRHFTFLQVAALHTNVAMAKLLVQHGAANTLAATNDDGNTALDIAVQNGHTAMADYLSSLMATNQSP